MSHSKRPLNDLDADIRDHIARETQDNIDRGMSADEARFAALRKFGNLTQIKEATREVWIARWLDQLAQDLRYGLRVLRKSPGFTLAAVLTLALGIGANAAIFSVVNSVLLEPLPYPHSEQLVALRQIAPGAAGLANFKDGLLLSASMYVTYAEQNRSFQSLGIWYPATASVTGLAEPEQVRVIFVSDGALEALDVPPVAGRWLNGNDQAPNGAQTVMLSYAYWRRRFGGDPSAIGRRINVASNLRQIVGVMPQGFRFITSDFDLIVPMALDRSSLHLAGFGYDGVGRLKPGVSIAQANADITHMIPIWMDSWSSGPDANPHVYETWRITPTLRLLKQDVIGNIGDVLWVVMATVGIVMLIVCANVANLLLVKGEARQQELAVRSALGAQTSRIVRQLLFESALLGVAGGAFGLLLAGAGLRLLLAIGPTNLPRLAEVSLDGRALVFTLVLSLLAALLSGLISACKYARRSPFTALRSEGRTASASHERLRARDALVVAQIALAFVLLVSAGLMIRTFVALRTIDPGFSQAAHLQLTRISIPAKLIADPAQVVRTQQAIADKVATIPGVSSVGFASEMPMEGFDANWDIVLVEGRDYDPGKIPPLQLFKYVSPGYLATVGTRLVAGRDLTWTDVYEHHHYAMVSENFATETWGSSTAALGKRFNEGYPQAPWWEVVGVVQNTRENGVQQKAPAMIYWPTLKENLYRPAPMGAIRTATFAIRTDRAGTAALLGELRQAVWAVNSNLPLASVRTMQSVYDESLARTSFTLTILGIAGAMALALGIIGIYGVVSYLVGKRTHEIGIRVALGAQPGDILRIVLGQGAKSAAIGVALGLVVSFALTRLMVAMLFGVSARDPLTFSAVVTALLAITLLACWMPARRAMRVDPMIALRHE